MATKMVRGVRRAPAPLTGAKIGGLKRSMSRLAANGGSGRSSGS